MRFGWAMFARSSLARSAAFSSTFLTSSLYYSQAESTPAHPQVTQTVETVEKVPFQKLIFEKWERNIEKRLVFYVPKNILATFWHFFSLLWEIFMNIFRTRGFSTVSLGGFLLKNDTPLKIIDK
jgi:hypothetical protein